MNGGLRGLKMGPIGGPNGRNGHLLNRLNGNDRLLNRLNGSAAAQPKITKMNKTANFILQVNYFVF